MTPFNPQSPVSAVLDLIRQHQRYKLAGQSRRLKLTSLEYKDLLARLEELPGLKSFMDDKLRYAAMRIAPTPVRETQPDQTRLEYDLRLPAVTLKADMTLHRALCRQHTVL
jgi:hypothetical protein